MLACLGPPPPLLAQLVAERLYAFPPPRPRFADVSTGLRLRYLEWGASGDVVLLLHDLGESADMWVPLAARLADRGYHVLAPDLRGERLAGLEGAAGAAQGNTPSSAGSPSVVRHTPCVCLSACLPARPPACLQGTASLGAPWMGATQPRPWQRM